VVKLLAIVSEQDAKFTKMETIINMQASEISGLVQRVNTMAYENAIRDKAASALKLKIDTMPKPEKLFLKYPLARVKDTLTVLK